MTSKRTALFATIPRPLLWTPPIRHRHTDDNKNLLQPFEFALAAGCVVLARWSITDDRHARSFAGAGKAIEREIRDADRFREAWRITKKLRRKGLSPAEAPAPQRHHTFNREKDRYRPQYKRDEAIKVAGHHEYRRLHRIERRKVPDVITVTASRAAILRAAGLRMDGGNFRKLSETLDRLCHDVGDMPGALERWQETREGKVQLEVRGVWLWPPFERVPLPLPISSPTACALYLLLHTVTFGEFNKKSFRFEKLCEIVGMPISAGRAACTRAINRALDIVNEHLHCLEFDALIAQGVRVAERYELQPQAHLHVRLIAIPYVKLRPEDGCGFVEPDNMIGFEDVPVERVLLTSKARKRMRAMLQEQ